MAKHRKKIQRCESGFSLVEVLVSLLIGSLIAGVMLDMFSKLQRTSATTQNEICANVIAQEMIESSRNLDYTYLSDRIGKSYQLLTNKTDSGQVGPEVRADPALLDLVNKIWNTKISTAKFPGEAYLNIDAADSIPDAVKVTSLVRWTDSERQANSAAFGRNIETSIIITKSGLNRWTP
jgi:prepilin-type N-terminal cleavage/methylation domain-containing protein